MKNVFYKKFDGKECNTVKGISAAAEFSEFKDVLFNKKITRDKMRRIQSKKHKIGTYEIEKKSLYHVLMIKDLFQMMEFRRRFIFIKS